MKKAFLSNIILLIVVNLLIKPAYIFGIEIPMQNTVGNQDYGTFFTFFGFTMLFQIINEAGFHQFSSSTVARHPGKAFALLRRITVLKIFLGALFMVTISAIGWWMGYWELDGRLLLLVGLNQVLIGYIPYLRSNLSSLGKYHWESIVSVLDKIVMILVIGYFLLYHREEFTIYHFVIGQTIGFVVSIAAIACLLWFALREVNPIAIDITLKDLGRQSLPFGFIIFLSMVYTRIDAVMIEGLLPQGATKAGIYGAAFRLMDAANMFAFLFAGLLLPMFSRMLEDRLDVKPLYKLSFKVVWVLAIGLAIPVWFMRAQIMNALYTEYSVLHGEVLGILFIAFVAKATTYVSGTLLMAENRLRSFNLLLLTTVVINILLNYWWIQSAGIKGAAWSTALTQSFVAFGCIFLLRNLFDWRQYSRLYLHLSLFAILCFLGVYLIADYWQPFNTWYLNGILSLCLCGILTLGLKVVHPKEILETFYQRLSNTPTSDT